MLINDAQRPLYELKANLFKGLAHPFRIRILELLSAADEVSVAQLLSQHLAVLRRHRLVGSERRGSHVYYRLANPATAEMLAVARVLLLDMLRTESAQLEETRTLPTLSALPAGGSGTR